MVQHFCATACIVDKDNKKILFIHHKKLNKWLYVGGHIEEIENDDFDTFPEKKQMAIDILNKIDSL